MSPDKARILAAEAAHVATARQTLGRASDALSVAERRVARYPRAGDRSEADGAVETARRARVAAVVALDAALAEQRRVAEMWSEVE